MRVGFVVSVLDLGLIPHWVLDQYYRLIKWVLSLELKVRQVLVLVLHSFSVRGCRWGRALIGRRTCWAAEKRFDLKLWRSPQTPSDTQTEHALEHVPNTTHGSEDILSSVAMATAWEEAVQIKHFVPRLHVGWIQSGNAVFSQSLRSNQHQRDHCENGLEVWWSVCRFVVTWSPDLFNYWINAQRNVS